MSEEKTQKSWTEKIMSNKDLLLGVLAGAVVGWWIGRMLLKRKYESLKSMSIPAPKSAEVRMPAPPAKPAVNITAGATQPAAGVAAFDNLGDLVGADGMGDLENIEYMEA